MLSRDNCSNKVRGLQPVVDKLTELRVPLGNKTMECSIAYDPRRSRHPITMELIGQLTQYGF